MGGMTANVRLLGLFGTLFKELEDPMGLLVLIGVLIGCALFGVAYVLIEVLWK